MFCLKLCTWHFHRDFGLNTEAILVNPGPSPRSPSAQSFDFWPVKLSSQLQQGCLSTEMQYLITSGRISEMGFSAESGPQHTQVYKKPGFTQQGFTLQNLPVFCSAPGETPGRNGYLRSPRPRRRCRGARGPRAGFTMSGFLF